MPIPYAHTSVATNGSRHGAIIPMTGVQTNATTSWRLSKSSVGITSTTSNSKEETHAHKFPIEKQNRTYPPQEVPATRGDR
jgi:hypothetical protein